MACNCIVIVREVWDTRDLVGQVLDGAGAVKTAALATRFEPEDLNALEAALRLKDRMGGTVTVLTLGGPGSVDVLREGLYRGADAAYRIAADPAAVDTAGAAALAAAAVRKIGNASLLLIGTTTTIEGENSLLGAHLAGRLGWEQITYVDQIEECTPEHVVGKRAVEMGYEYVRAPLPAVLAVGVALLEDDPRAPRSAKAMLKLKHKKTPIAEWSAAELGVDPAAERTTRIAGREAVPARAIETREVDPESEAALGAMLQDVLKGE